MRAAVLACLCLAGCATSERPERGPAPYAALISPTAALKVALDEVCLPAVLEGRSLEELALSRHLVPANPRRAGSPTATAAWRLASLGQVYVFLLPNGGCSVSLERGDADELNRQALAMLTARRPDVRLGLSEPTDRERAQRDAYCTSEVTRPYVVALVRRKESSRPTAFLANVFQAQADRPPFCSLS